MRARHRHRREDPARAGVPRTSASGRRFAAGVAALGCAAVVAAGLGASGAPARASQAVSDASLPRPGGPVAGASVTVTPRRGGATVFWPGAGWLRLGAAASLPLDTTLDAAHATVLLTSASDASGATQTEAVSGGAFQVAQTVGPAPVTRLTLYSDRAVACASPRSRTVVRRLTADGDGRLQIVAANVTATSRGGDWMIADRCDGTDVSVRSGRVTVWRTGRLHAGQRLVDVVPAGRSVLFAGPPPPRSPALPVLSTTVPSGGGDSAPTASTPSDSAPAAAPTASGPATPTTVAPALSPQQQLAVLVSSVDTLAPTGQPGQDLTGDLQATETALTFGTTSATCTALGTVGQAIFENAGAPSGAIPASTATSLLSATVAIDTALACSAPDATDLKASIELLGAIGGLAGLGADASITAAIAGQLAQAGQALVIDDDSDGCATLQNLAGSVGLVELGGELTTAQGQAVTAEITPIQTQLGC